MWVKLIFYAAIVAAIAGVLGWMHQTGVESGKRSRDKEVADLQQSIGEQRQAIGEYKAAYEHLAALTGKQNSSLQLLEERGRQAAQAATQALEQARADAQRNAGDVQRLRTLMGQNGASGKCEQAIVEVRGMLRAN